MKYTTFLFDFDGVLCKDRFYEKTLLPKYKNVYDWIQVNIFSNSNLVDGWMKGKINSKQINELISIEAKIEQNILNGLFKESVRLMKLDNQIIELAKKLKSLDKKIAIVTNNMDIFSEITVDSHSLDNIFDVIVNSADYGYLKKERNGSLFDIALTKMNRKIEESILIDDSQKNIALFERKGGKGFHYKNFNEFNEWMPQKTIVN